MCGIFSYIGKPNAAFLSIEGLTELEYRGYDSWGMAIQDSQGNIQVHKQVGAISDAEKDLHQNFQGHISIGHSRWATHGGVNKTNTHPHNSSQEDIYVVHNGIIENYLELKKDLQKNDYNFYSETDTEIIAALIEKELSNGKSHLEAIQATTLQMEGRYAFVVMFKGEEKLYAVRHGAPLIIGFKPDTKEHFIASDIPAFLRHTNQVQYMQDQEIAIVTSEDVEFFQLKDLQTSNHNIQTVDLDPESSELGEYPHFMIKEIMEQKQTIPRSINQDDTEIKDLANLIKNAKGVFFVGCGTAGKVGLTATRIFSEIAKKHINFEFASEFKHCKNYLTTESLVIAISQSGETADTLEALEIAQAEGAQTASIINVAQSTMDRLTDHSLHLKAGPEKAVASTKATTSQLAIVTLLAFACADRLEEGKEILNKTCQKLNELLNTEYEDQIKDLAQQIHQNESMYIIGKGINYPIALESAIKLQEVSYIHAEGFAGGELKHGPLALISQGTPAIVLAPKDENYSDIISNATEIKTRGGYIIGISPTNHEVFDYWLKVPSSDDYTYTSPILNLIPIQLLSYHLGLIKGNNPDKPRNLAKSVTVK